MLTVFTEIDLIDGNNDGFITQEQFTEGLISGKNLSEEYRLDFMYLAEKYREIDSFE